MGFRFRKSVKIGPARVNLSKSGVGFSIGTKGARISKSAKGKTRATIGVPGTGISFSKTIGGKKRKNHKAVHKKKAPSSRSAINREEKNIKSSGLVSFKKNWGTAIALSVLGFVFVCIASFIFLFIVDAVVALFNYDAATGRFALCVLVTVPALLGITVAVLCFRAYSPEKDKNREDLSMESEQTMEPAKVVEPRKPVYPEKSVEPMDSINPTSQKPIAHREPATEVKIYQVAGVEHYMDTLLSMARPNYLYDYKKQELIDTCHYDESIYKQTVDAEHLELTHEPDNPYDPNAIKVLLDGNLVGYIAAKDCKHILDIMDNDLFVSAACEVSGGKYKRVNEDYDCIKDKSTYKMETGEDPYSITIYIRERIL